jgi:nucleotide-binding universal stress UspA family protein
VPPGWEDGDGFASVGAGFVDTVDGHEALDGAHAIASRAGATLRVLAAVQPRSWMDGEPDLRTAAEQAAGAAIADLLGEPIDVDVQVCEPADLLLAASSELDLLVCGSRGYGPRPAVLLGGVTRQLTAGARCPVIVLAGGARPGLAP